MVARVSWSLHFSDPMLLTEVCVYTAARLDLISRSLLHKLFTNVGSLGLIKDFDRGVDVIKPGVSENFSSSYTLLWVSLKQSLDQIFGQVTQTDKV